MEGFWLALLEWLRLTGLKRFLFTTLRPEGGALVRLWTRVFVVSTVAPAYRRALRLGGRKDLDFCFFERWLRPRLGGTWFWFIAGHRGEREHLRPTGWSWRGGDDGIGLRSRLVDDGRGCGRGCLARKRMGVLALRGDYLD